MDVRFNERCEESKMQKKITPTTCMANARNAIQSQYKMIKIYENVMK